MLFRRRPSDQGDVSSVVDRSDGPPLPPSSCLSSSMVFRDSASVGKGTSYIMDNAAAKLKKKRMTKFEVSQNPQQE